MYIRERPQLRKGILKYCSQNNVTLIDMYVDYSSSNSVRKQIKKMLIEQDQLHIAERRKIMKDREDLNRK